MNLKNWNEHSKVHVISAIAFIKFSKTGIYF
jgi:hypothetical protein